MKILAMNLTLVICTRNCFVFLFCRMAIGVIGMLDVVVCESEEKVMYDQKESMVQESLATARLCIDDILHSVDCGALNIEVKNLRNMVVVLIKGAQGSGKTSFAREMRKQLEQDGDLSIAWWSSPRGYNDIEDAIFLDDYPDSLELIKSMDSADRFSDGRFNRYTTSPKSPLIMVATVNV